MNQQYSWGAFDFGMRNKKLESTVSYLRFGLMAKAPYGSRARASLLDARDMVLARLKGGAFRDNNSYTLPWWDITVNLDLPGTTVFLVRSP